jgi:hypothetical protein
MRTLTELQLRHALRALDQPGDLADQIFAATEAETPDSHTGHVPRFEPAHVAYYLGALLIIGAMGWFITNAWDTLPGIRMAGIALLYGAGFGVAGILLARRPNHRVPGGVLVTVAVCMTPLFVYGIEKQLGWWPADAPGGYARFHPYIHASWILMELATVLVAALFLRAVRFPFITAPAAYALWYLSMDGTAFVFGKTWTFHQECWFSIGFGAVLLAIAYFADGWTELDFSFWFYLFGLLTFCGGLSLLGDGHELGLAIYCLIHLALIGLALVLERRVFLVFGGIGVFAYLEQEASRHFRDSFRFSIALTIIGILFIAGGLLYKRNEPEWAERLAPLRPQRVRRRLENR